MSILDFIREQVKNLDVDYEIKDLVFDGYEVLNLRSGRWKLVANNARSCLWGINHIKNNGGVGKFEPRFQVRGINPCESLARHTSKQIGTLIDRMAQWRMNTIIIHQCYGYMKHKELVDRLCEERGIEIIYYLQTALAFTSNADVSVFALEENGNPRTPYANNETRLCPAKQAARDTFREGARSFFNSDSVAPGSRFVLMDGDGYLFCKCPECRDVKPVDQWAVFLEIAIEEAEKSNKNLEIEYLSYVWRYARPKEFELFDKINGVMFDTHQRFRWAPINSDHPKSPYSEVEAQADYRALDIPLNKYLYDRLKEWRENFKGRVYVFENLMIQGSISCPQPYTDQLLQDLDTYSSLGADGIVYEAFELGIESFDRQISMLAKSLWQRDKAYELTDLEKLCIRLTGDEVKFDFKNQFNVISYLTVRQPDAIDILKREGFDSVLIEYAKFLRAFLESKTLDNYSKLMKYAIQHKDRLDWMMAGFNLIRASLKENVFEFEDDKVNEFLTVSKLWDIQEDSSDPISDTEICIFKILDAIESDNIS